MHFFFAWPFFGLWHPSHDSKISVKLCSALGENLINFTSEVTHIIYMPR